MFVNMSFKKVIGSYSEILTYLDRSFCTLTTPLKMEFGTCRWKKKSTLKTVVLRSWQNMYNDVLRMGNRALSLRIALLESILKTTHLEVHRLMKAWKNYINGLWFSISLQYQDYCSQHYRGFSLYLMSVPKVELFLVRCDCFPNIYKSRDRHLCLNHRPINNTSDDF